MAKDSLFDGDSLKAQFATLVYKRLMSRELITYTDVMADYLPEPMSGQISYFKDYGELRKAFRDVYNAIIEEVGEDCIEVQGNNRNRRTSFKSKTKRRIYSSRMGRNRNRITI